MSTQLKTQITKLRVMAEMVIAECNKTEAMMDKPVSKIAVNKERRRAESKADLLRRLTRTKQS